MRLAFVAVLFAGLCGLTPSARAEDFTFNVPVRVENMRFAESGILGCIVSAGTTLATSRVVRAPEVTFPITDGAYRGVVTTTVNLASGERRDAFNSWSCTIYVSFRPPGGALLNGGDFGPARFVTEYPARTSQAIASQSMVAQGMFSR